MKALDRSVNLRVVDHLEAFEHLIDQVLNLLLGQALDLHEFPQVCPHERHHQVAAEVASGTVQILCSCTYVQLSGV